MDPRLRTSAAIAGLAGVLVLTGCGERGAPKRPAKDYMQANVERWTGELQRFGQGDWAQWEQAVAPFHQVVRTKLKETPETIKGIPGTGGFLFFRRSLDYLAGGELRGQPDQRDPYPVIAAYAKQLKAKGIDLLYCPIPVKAAVFPDKLAEVPSPAEGPYVNPHVRKLMLELAPVGVECVDLLPHFLAARGDQGGEPVYQRLDTHWTHRTLRLTARLLAERIRDYDWFPEVANSPVTYSVKEVKVKRRGDIVRWLPPKLGRKYPTETIAAEQVLKPDGAFYEDEQTSPIVMLGDSYAGVFHFEDCKHAGISAHLARELGVPIDLVLGQGMGPKVWGILRRRGAGALKGKRLVIWLMTTRDLHNYRDPWKVVPFP